MSGRRGKAKPQKVIRTHLDPAQFAALQQFQKDYVEWFPKMQEAAAVSQELFKQIKESPMWRIAESVRPDHVPEPTQPQEWKVGHAKVNYVDKIETGVDQ